jgi:hypothetical protein
VFVPKKKSCPMEFILTVIFYYVEPDRPTKVQREQHGSYAECNRARLEAISKPPAGVKTVSANCVSGHLSKTWVNR